MKEGREGRGKQNGERGREGGASIDKMDADQVRGEGGGVEGEG